MSESVRECRDIQKEPDMTDTHYPSRGSVRFDGLNFG